MSVLTSVHRITTDFGSRADSANLVIKGIIGINAMAEMSAAVNNQTDSQHYSVSAPCVYSRVFAHADIIPERSQGLYKHVAITCPSFDPHCIQLGGPELIVGAAIQPLRSRDARYGPYRQRGGFLSHTWISPSNLSVHQVLDQETTFMAGIVSSNNRMPFPSPFSRKDANL